MAHASHSVPGVEFSTGSLGHGLPFATGMAYALKCRNSSSRVFVLVGDGELAEGTTWEALLFASHHKLNNLVLIVDSNNLQSLTTVTETLNLSPLAKKFSAFGWEEMSVDGHNHSELRVTLSTKSATPRVIIAQTIKGRGVDFMENKVEWHYRNPGPELFAIALGQLRGDTY